MTKRLGRPKQIDNTREFSIGDKRKAIFLHELTVNGRVRIDGLGVFILRKVKPRKLYHNFAEKVITIPSFNKIHFVPESALRIIING